MLSDIDACVVFLGFAGRQLSKFNHLSQVYIGGMRDTMGKLVQSFHGTIAGIVLHFVLYCIL